MSDVLSRATTHLAALRDDFDRSFERPLELPDPGGVQLLCIRAAEERVALRLDEVQGLHLCSVIARVPGSPADLLGLATLRGQLWPAYDLAALMGWNRPGPRRVLCLARSRPPLAFAFESLDSLRRVRPDELVRVSVHESSTEALKDGDELVPLLSLTALARRCHGIYLADGKRTPSGQPLASTDGRGDRT